MTVNIIAKRNDKKFISSNDVSDLMYFCDMKFGMKDDEVFWFQRFATDRDSIYSTAEDVDKDFDIELFDQYTKKHPEMSIYVECVM